MKPWAWREQQKAPVSNTLAPLASAPDVAPPPVQVQTNSPLSGVPMALAEEAWNSGMTGSINPSAKTIAPLLAPNAATGAGSQAAMLASQMEGFGNEGMKSLAEATGNSFNPLTSAMGGVLEGNYGKAAGSAAGATVGTPLGPLGIMMGSRVGGWLGGKATGGK